MNAPISVHPYGRTTQVRHFRLANGLQALILEDHAAPVAAAQLWFGVGSRHDPEGRTGMAHLFEHLMFKESANLAEGEFDRVMEENGVSTNAATWLDWTYYQEDLPSSRLDLVLRLEAERLENMLLGEHQLETEREVVLNERRLRVDSDPEGRLYEDLYRELFRSHPYGSPTLGWTWDIQAITLADCLDFRARYYSPDRACVVLVGDVDTDDALERIERYFGHLPASGGDQAREEPPASLSETIFLDRRVDISNRKILMAWMGPTAGDGRVAALHVLNDLLMGRDSARLHRELVEEREWATSIDGWIGAFGLGGVFEVQVDLQPEADFDRTIERIDAALADVAENPPSERDLETSRNRVLMNRIRGDLSASSRARRLGQFHLTLGDYRQLFRMTEAFDRVSAEDVQAAAADFLHDQPRIILRASPEA